MTPWRKLRRWVGRVRRLPRQWLGPIVDTIPRQVLAEYLPPDPVIIEAGAAEGMDAAASARFWPRGKIYAFEPVPMAYDLLLAATAGLNNVECLKLGLYDHVGQMAMHISDNGYVSSSVLKPTGHLKFYPSVKFPMTMMLPMTTLDIWAAERGVARVDFMWLDMQGAELAALKSGPRVLENVSAIYTEVARRTTYEGAPLYPEFRAWLEARGFQVVKEVLAYRDYGNVLFVNEANRAKRMAAPMSS